MVATIVKASPKMRYKNFSTNKLYHIDGTNASTKRRKAPLFMRVLRPRGGLVWGINIPGKPWVLSIYGSKENGECTPTARQSGRMIQKGPDHVLQGKEG